MNNKQKLERLIYLFKEFVKLLYENHGHHHIRGVIGILGILTDENIKTQQRLEEARNSYRSMMGGMGTLGDFAIWNKDEVLMRKLNKYLGEIQDEIWRLLDCKMSHLRTVEEGYPFGYVYWCIIKSRVRSLKGKIKDIIFNILK